MHLKYKFLAAGEAIRRKKNQHQSKKKALSKCRFPKTYLHKSLSKWKRLLSLLSLL
jgi:hypothetical protein